MILGILNFRSACGRMYEFSSVTSLFCMPLFEQDTPYFTTYLRYSKQYFVPSLLTLFSTLLLSVYQM
jgi:hypothetical protein